MSIMKRGARFFGMALVAVGLIATIAGADKEGADQTVTALEDLIYEIKKAEEVNAINQKDFQNDWKVAQQDFRRREGGRPADAPKP
jgi:hypothetical protein